MKPVEIAAVESQNCPAECRGCGEHMSIIATLLARLLNCQHFVA